MKLLLQTQYHIFCNLLLLLFYLTSINTVEASFVVEVPFGGENCFVIRTPPGPEKSFVTGSFELLEDSLPDPNLLAIVILADADVAAKKLNTNNKKKNNDDDNGEERALYSSPPAVRTGTFSLTTTGRIHLCVRIGMHQVTKLMDKKYYAKYIKDNYQVGIDLHVQALDEKSAVHALIQKVHSQIWNLRSTQDYMRTREALHRQLSESTFSGMLFWSLLEAFFVFLIGFGQVYYIKQFIDKKRQYYQ